jgi:hypothetical protein
MYGLSVRWSLADARPGVEDELRTYVRESSIERFTGLAGLRFKTWRMVPGQWFEGTYVWDSPDARARFLETFQAAADVSPGSTLIGSTPVAYEEFEVVGVAEGGAGFSAGPGPGTP